MISQDRIIKYMKEYPGDIGKEIYNNSYIIYCGYVGVERDCSNGECKDYVLYKGIRIRGIKINYDEIENELSEFLIKDLEDDLNIWG